MTMKNDQITAQFNLLIRERDEYNKVAAQEERERRREEQVLSGHRSSAQQVADQLRVAQAEDGEGTRRLQNLKDAKDRLERQIEGDRAEMMKLTNELRGTEEEEKRQKWKFVREMEGLNDELDGLLSKEESEKTLRLIDTETIQWLVETKLDTWMNLDQEGIDENDAEVSTEKWREVRSKIETTLNALIEAREKVDEGVKEKNELEKTLVTLRQKFGIVHSNLGHNEIDSLESKWEETTTFYQDRYNTPNKADHEGAGNKQGSSISKAVHMQIFYHDQ